MSKLNEDFTSKLNSIICGSNVDVIKTFPEKCVDLVVCSPPYDSIRNYNNKLETNNTKEIIGKYSFPFEELVPELYRVMKLGGVVVWIVNDQTILGFDEGRTETGNSMRQALFFQDQGFNIHDTMIYKKPGVRFPDQIRYHQSFEYMFVFSKGKPNTVNLIKDRKNVTYKIPKSRIDGKTKNKRWTDDELVICHDFDNNPLKKYGARYNVWDGPLDIQFDDLDKEATIDFRYNIWEVPLEQATRTNIDEWNWHPAVFPSSLAKDHIITWTKEGDVVLDPFSGSGTTAKMAKKLNRKYIGIDLNEEYVNKSSKWIESYHTMSNKMINDSGKKEDFMVF